MSRSVCPRPERVFHYCLALAYLVAIPMLVHAAAPAEPGEKELVMDGSIVHDVGQLWLNITNWGLIGSHPGAGTPYSHAPSARWPGATGVDHLYAAGLWVGATRLGVPFVSTGQFESEFRPTDDPLDIIYTMAHGDAGGSRYPFPDPDDDGDGLEDEDPKNRLDDDGDGLIDEDFAAISDQHYRFVSTDTVTVPYPDHSSLGLEVTQQSFQWQSPLIDDFVGFDLTIRNIGDDVLEDLYVGVFADCDLPAVPGSAEDDMAGMWEGVVRVYDGSFVPVSMGYMFDGGETGTLAGYFGLLFLDHPTDSTGVPAPAVARMSSFQIMNAQMPFDQGGDPTNDAERYELLSDRSFDNDTPAGRPGDFRFLIGSGPFATLAPGEELTYTFAMVAGPGFQGLLNNAAMASIIWRGSRFDRDGDPNTGPDGKEHVVRWLRPENFPVPTVSGELGAGLVHGSVELAFTASLDTATDLLIDRHTAVPGDLRRWGATEFTSLRVTPHGVEASLLDRQPGGWPRTYRLILQTPAGETVLDEIIVTSETPRREVLQVWPNPFNPRVEISVNLEKAGPMDLEVYDLRGFLVRTLMVGLQPAGELRVFWDGQDGRGQPVASGVYQLSLRAGQRWWRRPITLVR